MTAAADILLRVAVVVIVFVAIFFAITFYGSRQKAPDPAVFLFDDPAFIDRTDTQDQDT